MPTKGPPTPDATPTEAAVDGAVATPPAARPAARTRARRPAAIKATPEPRPTPPPETLAVDVGGTGIKGSVLDIDGHMAHERIRVPTPYPLSPQRLIETIDQLVRDLPPFDRISVGFPGMVRDGKVLTAPHFLGVEGPDAKTNPKLLAAWTGFDLAGSLTTAFAKPAKVANDADLQGLAVVTGTGLEFVVTLGTGFGTAMFYQGQLCPHMEIGHHRFRGNETYDEQLGDAARKVVGPERWNRRVRRMIDNLRALVFFDHLYMGGGNAIKVKGDLPPDVSVVDNTAGILGGIKLWEQGHLA